MLEMLHRVFGIDTLQEIRFQIEALTSEIPQEKEPDKAPGNAVVSSL